MSITTDEKGTYEQVPKLTTEGPLAEKDQQGMAIELQRKLSEKAMAQWQRIKGKAIHSFKK
jgi:hypothetical protein